MADVMIAGTIAAVTATTVRTPTGEDIVAATTVTTDTMVRMAVTARMRMAA